MGRLFCFEASEVCNAYANRRFTDLIEWSSIEYFSVGSSLFASIFLSEPS